MKKWTVVADASVLIGLARIDKLNFLETLFGEILVSEEVYREVVKGGKVGAEEVQKSKFLKVVDITDKQAVDLLLKNKFPLSEKVIYRTLREAGEV